jgi:hypothetical protein
MQTQIIRLTDTFYSFKSSADNIDTWFTYAPYYLDLNYNLPLPLSYDAAYNHLILKGISSADAQKQLSAGIFRPTDPPENPEFIDSYGGGTLSDTNKWIITLSDNGSVFRPTDSSSNYKFLSNPVIGTDNSGNFYTSISVPTGLINPDHKVEISFFQASEPFSPWIYYGYTRPDLATRLDIYNPRYVGGVRPELVPASGIVMRYTVDCEISLDISEGNLVLVSMDPSAMLYLPVIIEGAMISNLYGIFSLIDGKDIYANNKELIKSYVTFSVSNTTAAQSLLGKNTVAFSTDTAASPYQNVHYKRLNYNTQTYTEKKVIQKARLFLCMENNKKNSGFYKNLFWFFNFFIKRFFSETASYSAYQFYDDVKNNVLAVSQLANDFYLSHGQVNVSQISSIAADVSPSLSILLPTMIGYDFVGSSALPISFSSSSMAIGITVDVSGTYIVDVDLFLNGLSGITFNSIIKAICLDIKNYENPEDTSDKTNPIDMKYRMAIFSECNWIDIPKSSISGFTIKIGDIGIKNKNYQSSADAYDKVQKKFIFVSNIQYPINIDIINGFLGLESSEAINIFTEENPTIQTNLSAENYSNALNIFGSNDIQRLTESENYDCFLWSFLNLFLKKLDISVTDEMSLVSVSDYVDGNLLLENSQRSITDIKSIAVSPTDSENINKIIGRLNYIYGDWKNDSKNPVFDYLNEMRYWRCLCPIGQIFKATGKILLLNLRPDGSYDGYMDNNLPFHIEEGANLSATTLVLGQTIEIQGRWFYPYYFYGLKKDPVGAYMTLTWQGDITQWYDVSSDLAKYFSESRPSIVVRNRTFSENDYCMVVSAGSTDASLMPGESVSVVYAPDAIPLYSLSFDIDLKDGSSNDDFEYEIRYTLPGSDNSLLLRYFNNFSVLDTGVKKMTITTDFSKPFVLPAIWDGVSDKSKFIIARNYNVNVNTNQKIIPFVFTRDQFVVSNVYLNGLSVSFSYSNGLDFTKDCTIDTLSGTIFFSKEIDAKNSIVSVSIVNITNYNSSTFNLNQYNIIKSISGISIQRIMQDPSVNQPREKVPEISNLRVNYGSSYNSEPVECWFSAVAGSARTFAHYICPTQGFVYLSNDGSWSYQDNIPSGQNTAGGSSSTVIQGYLNSPSFIFDFFAKDQADGLIDKTATTLPSIIVRQTNLIPRLGTQPLVETETFYIAPKQAAVSQLLNITSEYSHGSDKIFLVYMDAGGTLQQKTGSLGFASRTDTGDNTKGQNMNFSKDNISFWYDFSENFSVCSGGIYESPIEYQPVFTGDGRLIIPVSFDPNNTDFLVGFSLGTKSSDNSSKKSAMCFDLCWSDQHTPHGYTSFSGEGRSIRAFVSDSNDASSRYHLPDIDFGMDLYLVESTESPRDKSVNNNIPDFILTGCYAHKIHKGIFPQIIEFLDGSFLLFYIETVGQVYNIKMLRSNDNCNSWYGETLLYQISNSILNLIVIKNKKENNCTLLYYDTVAKSIESFMLPYICIRNIMYDYNDDAIFTDTNTIKDNVNLFSENGVLVYFPANDKDSLSKEGSNKNAILIDSWHTYFGNVSGSKLYILQDATQVYSVARSESGLLFLVYMATSGSMKFLYNYNVNVSDQVDRIQWQDSGFDINDSRIPVNAYLKNEQILNVKFSFSPENKVFLFVSTQNRLVVSQISYSIFGYLKDIVSNSQNTNNDILFQELAKEPVLIVGMNEDGADLVQDNAHVQEDFIPQLVSIQWQKGGRCLLFYNNKKGIQCLASDNMLDWVIFTDI